MDVNIDLDIDTVKAVVVGTLGVEDRAEALDATPLLGSLLELDSVAVLELGQRRGATIEGEDITADVFNPLASPAAFVDDKLR